MNKQDIIDFQTILIASIKSLCEKTQDDCISRGILSMIEETEKIITRGQQ